MYISSDCMFFSVREQISHHMPQIANGPLFLAHVSLEINRSKNIAVANRVLVAYKLQLRYNQQVAYNGDCEWAVSN